MRGKSRDDTTDDALTEQETVFLKSERSPALVRAFLARQHDSVGVRSSAYRKVAAAARAEREALTEVALLGIVRVRAEGSSELNGRFAELEAERARLERELSDTRLRLRQVTAGPALAVHGEGTGR